MGILLSKTAALKVAQESHSQIFRKGFGHSFTAPWKTCDPDGPCIEVDLVSFWAAREKRAQYVASMALEYMGYDAPTANSLTYDQHGSARSIVDRAIKRKPMTR